MPQPPPEVILSGQELNLIRASIRGIGAAISLLSQAQAGWSAPGQPQLVIEDATRAGLYQALETMNALLSRSLEQAASRAAAAAAVCQSR